MYAVMITGAFALCVGVILALCIKSGYVDALFFKYGLRQKKAKMNWSAFSWDSCLRKWEHSADVVFFGDSITRGGDFHQAFPSAKVINLGSTGDTLTGMMYRVATVKLFSPQKIFFMGGINGLTNMNMSLCAKQYAQLLDALREAVPDAEIYVHSVLPIARSKEKLYWNNRTIEAFNEAIKKIADSRSIPFVDLYGVYVKDGSMNPALTVDGIHLKPEAYQAWYDAIAPFMNS